MSEDHTYHGYPNYETWLAALWIDNDQHTYNHAREIATDAFNDADEDNERIRVADALKDWAEGAFLPDLPASLASDLLTAAFSEVDWLAIADHCIEDLDLTRAEDEEDDGGIVTHHTWPEAEVSS